MNLRSNLKYYILTGVVTCIYMFIVIKKFPEFYWFGAISYFVGYIVSMSVLVLQFKRDNMLKDIGHQLQISGIFAKYIIQEKRFLKKITYLELENKQLKKEVNKNKKNLKE